LPGRAPLWLLTAACAVTAVWFPARYWELVKEFDPLASWLVLVRGVLLLACFLPFLVLGPAGVVDSVGRQLGRPLQIESLGAGFLLAAHQAFGLGIEMRSSAGSQNLVGTLPDALAAVLSVLQAGVLVAIWVAFARGPAEPARLARFAAAAVVAFVALGKVLSPQFLIWLVPLVALVRGRAAALLVAALVVTQLWFPFRYWDLVRDFDPLASWLVPLRDLLLVALLAILLAPRADRKRTAAPYPPSPRAQPTW
jgi:hypothetical protein